MAMPRVTTAIMVTTAGIILAAFGLVEGLTIITTVDTITTGIICIVTTIGINPMTHLVGRLRYSKYSV